MFITAMSLMTNDITCQMFGVIGTSRKSAWSARIFRHLSTKLSGIQSELCGSTFASAYAIRQRVHVRLECRSSDVTCLWEGTVRRRERVMVMTVIPQNVRSAVDQ
jgi:hypothetical protein